MKNKYFLGLNHIDNTTWTGIVHSLLSTSGRGSLKVKKKPSIPFKLRGLGVALLVLHN